MNIFDKEHEIKQLYNRQKFALYGLLGLIFSAFVGLQLSRIEAIAKFNYNLHEILFVPFTIAFFVVPGLFIVYTYYLVRYVLKRGKRKPSLKTSMKAISVLAALIVIGLITAHQFQEVSTSGVFMVEKKLQEDEEYYLVLDDKKVSVSYNVFQLVEEDQQYLISFVWNKKTPYKGKLKRIARLTNH